MYVGWMMCVCMWVDLWACKLTYSNIRTFLRLLVRPVPCQFHDASTRLCCMVKDRSFRCELPVPDSAHATWHEIEEIASVQILCTIDNFPRDGPSSHLQPALHRRGSLRVCWFADQAADVRMNLRQRDLKFALTLFWVVIWRSAVYATTNETATNKNLTFMLVTSFGAYGFNSSGTLPAAEIALRTINSRDDILPGYNLVYDTVRDSKVCEVCSYGNGHLPISPCFITLSN